MNATRASSRAKRGFTIIEVIIAVALFGVGITALTSMQLYSIRGANSGRHQTQASAIAESQMEQLQRLTWSQLSAGGGWSTPVTRNNMVQSGVEKAYDLDWRVTDLVAGWTRTIDVRVRWGDPGRLNRSVVLSSIRFNHEGV